MCGFAGFLDRSAGLPESEWQALLFNMVQAIAHRGPDDWGFWTDADAGLALAHCRLSILDLSSAGHQPMISPSGRFVIAFNGEIYNHLDLRKELAVQTWRGHSDTETLLAGFDARGVDGTIERAIGMFAFVVWDKTNLTLTLARDRLGEKPLYYGWQDETFLFGSELKALKPHPTFHAEIDRNALALFMRQTIFPRRIPSTTGYTNCYPDHC